MESRIKAAVQWVRIPGTQGQHESETGNSASVKTQHDEIVLAADHVTVQVVGLDLTIVRYLEWRDESVGRDLEATLTRFYYDWNGRMMARYRIEEP